MRILMMIAVATPLILSGCNDDDNRPSADTTSPMIDAIANIEIAADTTSDAVNFTITDNRDSANQLMITASSSSQVVVADESIQLTSDGNQYSITLTPESDTVGEASITVIAVDSAGNSSSEIFSVTVVPRQLSENALVQTIVNLGEDAEPVFINQVTISGEVGEAGFDSLVNQ